MTSKLGLNAKIMSKKITIYLAQNVGHGPLRDITLDPMRLEASVFPNLQCTRDCQSSSRLGLGCNHCHIRVRGGALAIDNG